MTSVHTAVPAIDADERARRLDIVDESRHNAEIEGLIADAVHEADATEWVEGKITLDELIQRGLDRYTVA
jgi:hypothetical protein